MSDDTVKDVKARLAERYDRLDASAAERKRLHEERISQLNPAADKFRSEAVRGVLALNGAGLVASVSALGVDKLNSDFVTTAAVAFYIGLVVSFLGWASWNAAEWILIKLSGAKFRTEPMRRVDLDAVQTSLALNAAIFTMRSQSNSLLRKLYVNDFLLSLFSLLFQRVVLLSGIGAFLFFLGISLFLASAWLGHGADDAVILKVSH